MFTKTTLALALVIGTASFALAGESDPNVLNRYPAYNMTKQFAAPIMQTSSVALTSGYAVKSPAQSWIDRASFNTGQ